MDVDIRNCVSPLFKFPLFLLSYEITQVGGMVVR